MFKSYEKDSDTDDWYRIIDDDFVVKVDYYDCEIKAGHARLLSFCVIKEYEKRGLNVAGNLALAFKKYVAQNIKGGYEKVSIQKITEANKTGNPYYAKYADEVEKYLLLI